MRQQAQQLSLDLFPAGETAQQSGLVINGRVQPQLAACRASSLGNRPRTSAPGRKIHRSSAVPDPAAGFGADTPPAPRSAPAVLRLRHKGRCTPAQPAIAAGWILPLPSSDQGSLVTGVQCQSKILQQHTQIFLCRMVRCWICSIMGPSFAAQQTCAARQGTKGLPPLPGQALDRRQKLLCPKGREVLHVLSRSDPQQRQSQPTDGIPSAGSCPVSSSVRVSDAHGSSFLQQSWVILHYCSGL